MRTLRRFLVVLGLMFWQGGFLFYVSVVVPIGTSVLRSALRQGFITREVTRNLNIAAAVALVLLAWDILATRDRSTPRRWTRIGLWLFLTACQAGLFYLHAYLDARMSTQGMIVFDPEHFHTAHRVYLWLHTVQWAGALVFLALMLKSWSREDAASLSNV